MKKIYLLIVILCSINVTWTLAEDEGTGGISKRNKTETSFRCLFEIKENPEVVYSLVFSKSGTNQQQLKKEALQKCIDWDGNASRCRFVGCVKK